MGSNAPVNYAIVGGGLTGVCLGLALHQRGIPFHIYEQANQFGEIGSGLSHTANGVQAMKICHPGIFAAFEEVKTQNAWPSKRRVLFDIYDGLTSGNPGASTKPIGEFDDPLGSAGTHRARFLEAIAKLIPPETASFNKRLSHYTDSGNDEMLRLYFEDGTTATATAIIGCDGIKSKVRRLLFGEDAPCASPVYTHRFTYRALVSMEDAIAAVGEERALNATLYTGPGGHILTFGIENRTVLNVVAIHADPNEWEGATYLTKPSDRNDLLRDFADWGKDVTSLLKLAKPNLDIWAVFDLGDHPPPTWARDRVCIVGDAAHASSPHHGAGAGMCMEDAAVLSELLAHEQIRTTADVVKAFAIFDKVRRPRGEFLVESSRFMGKVFEYEVPACPNIDSIVAEMLWRRRRIQDVDVKAMCEEAKEKLAVALA